MAEVTQVTTPDGRILEVHAAGDPAGRAVVAHHGTPGSGVIYSRDADLAADRGLRLISYDRPGYGGSDRHHGRSIADAAADVAAILDALGVDRFATWGASGGGPHALACAALLGDRCVAAHSVAGIAPYGGDGLDYFAGMAQDNVAEFGAALQGEAAMAAFLVEPVTSLREIRGEDVVPALGDLLPPADAALAGGGLIDWLADSIRHGLAAGAQGWLDDDLAFVAGWGFEPGGSSAHVAIWHGEQDLMVPVGHGRWLGEHVRGAELHLCPDDGHLSLGETQMPLIYDAMARYTF
jgi:pimeloyl-ACP methyl ester carboxylesterase